MMAITNKRRKERMLVSDAEVRARASRVERLLRIVCGKDEFPYFVSDAATVYEVGTGEKAKPIAIMLVA
jgi:hypothetical protein